MIISEHAVTHKRHENINRIASDVIKSVTRSENALLIVFGIWN